MPFDIQVKGTVTAEPLPTDEALLGKGMPIDFRKTYTDIAGGVYAIGNTAVPISLGGSTVLKMISLRSVNGETLLVDITTAAGTLQRVPVSGSLLLHNPAAGSAVTTLQVTGPGRLELLVAGDPA